MLPDRLIRAALLLALAWASPVHADVGAGRALYDAKGCAGCHAIAGAGGQVGPDLSAEGTRKDRDRAWHIAHLMNPAGVVPGSIMPPLVKSEADAGHLADFLLTLAGTPPAKAAPTPPARPAAAAPAPERAPKAAPVPRRTVQTPAGLVGNSVDGEALYQSRGCPLCHTIDGEGGTIGPDLSGAGNDPKRDVTWHMAYVMNPSQIVPGTRMPAVIRDPREAAHIAAYLMTRVTGVAPVPKAPDPAAGQHVFVKRGCGACHSIRGTGGALGPDLTFEGEVAGHDADWHRRHLANPKATSPASTMPRFNLPEREREDLVAYLLSLVRLEQDKRLSPALAARFADLGGSLEVLKGRIEKARQNGRNVDDFNVTLGEAWTHVGAVEDMIRRENLVGADKAIAQGEGLASELEGALTAFELALEKRHLAAIVVLFAILLGCWLLLKKINLLTLEWKAENAIREAEAESAKRKALPPGEPPCP
ncbi:MAG: c-type cytochrome [Nitrospirae bacterium]|nr:c-type cytochrome [Nitrospirota bacterium]